MKPRTAIALVVTAAALWGTTGTAQALGPDGIDPLAVGTFRLAVAAPALWVIASFLGEARRHRRHPVPGRAAGGNVARGGHPRRDTDGGTLLGAVALGVGLIVVSADELGQRRQGADVAH